MSTTTATAPSNAAASVVPSETKPPAEPLPPSGSTSTAKPERPAIEDQFRLQEFTELKKEIQSCSDETRKLENFCLIGSAAIFSWTATQSASPAVQSHTYVAALIPPLLVLFGWIKCTALEGNIQEIGAYIASLEKKILPLGGGWESHYASSKQRRKLLPEIVSGRFWPLLFVTTCLTSLFLLRETPIGKLIGAAFGKS